MKKVLAVAASMPVARVCIDTSLPHLDHTFDYLIPTQLTEQVQVGTQVRVRFAGRLTNGFVLERSEQSDHTGKLSFIERAISPDPVLNPDITQLAQEIAARYAGTLSDVLRLAIPPRHAGAEKMVMKTIERVGTVVSSNVSPPAMAGWRHYDFGSPFLRALGDGKPARAVWTALPGEDWSTRLAEVITATLASQRGVVAVVPDARDLAQLDKALAKAVGHERYVVLNAALGPQERYRRWLMVKRGLVHCVVGTRAAAFAPVARLGLVAIWDDGDSSHAEPRAPYCHAREVLLTRAEQAAAGALIAGYVRTVEAQFLLETGWAKPITASRDTVRQYAPRITALGDEAQLATDAAAASARLPSIAWRVARQALAANTPVLVQVPRRGYVPSLNCQHCRTPARCTTCAGPLSLSGGQTIPACRWCARPHVDWRCGVCGSGRLRAAVVGARRTAEELGRAFPQIPVITSSGEAMVQEVAAQRALVVSTPGAEPVVQGGYGAALLLDTWALLTRVDLRASEEALRRWIGVAALVRPASDGGQVVITADAGLSVVQALVRWDPAGYAARELVERAEVGFPPVVRIAKLVGSSTALVELTELAQLPASAELLGPVPVDEYMSVWEPESSEIVREQLLIRVPRRDGKALAASLRSALAIRSAKKVKDLVRVQIDPYALA